METRRPESSATRHLVDQVKDSGNMSQEELRQAAIAPGDMFDDIPLDDAPLRSDAPSLKELPENAQKLRRAGLAAAMEQVREDQKSRDAALKPLEPAPGLQKTGLAKVWDSIKSWPAAIKEALKSVFARMLGGRTSITERPGILRKEVPAKKKEKKRVNFVEKEPEVREFEIEEGNRLNDIKKDKEEKSKLRAAEAEPILAEQAELQRRNELVRNLFAQYKTDPSMSVIFAKLESLGLSPKDQSAANEIFSAMRGNLGKEELVNGDPEARVALWQSIFNNPEKHLEALQQAQRNFKEMIPGSKNKANQAGEKIVGELLSKADSAGKNT